MFLEIKLIIGDNGKDVGNKGKIEIRNNFQLSLNSWMDVVYIVKVIIILVDLVGG